MSGDSLAIIIAVLVGMATLSMRDEPYLKKLMLKKITKMLKV
jgi:hypothetical protein